MQGFCLLLFGFKDIGSISLTIPFIKLSHLSPFLHGWVFSLWSPAGRVVLPAVTLMYLCHLLYQKNPFWFSFTYPNAAFCSALPFKFRIAEMVDDLCVGTKEVLFNLHRTGTGSSWFISRVKLELWKVSGIWEWAIRKWVIMWSCVARHQNHTFTTTPRERGRGLQ